MTTFHPLLDPTHSREIATLNEAFQAGGNSQWSETVTQSNPAVCPVTAYVSYTELKDALNLTSLRVLYRRLRESGYLAAAIEVLKEVSERSQQISDNDALKRLAEDNQIHYGDYEGIGAFAQSDHAPKSKGHGRKRTLFVIGTEHGQLDEERVAEQIVSLRDAGYEVSLATVGEGVTPSKHEIASAHNLPSISSNVEGTTRERFEGLATTFIHLANTLRVNSVYLQTPLRESSLILRACLMLDIPVVWEPSFDEAQLRIGHARQQICETHIPDRQQAYSELQAYMATNVNKVVIPDGSSSTAFKGVGGIVDKLVYRNAVAESDALRVHVAIDAARMNSHLTRIISRSIRKVSERGTKFTLTLIGASDQQGRLFEKSLDGIHGSEVTRSNDWASVLSYPDSQNFYLFAESPTPTTWQEIQARLQFFEKLGFMSIGPALSPSLRSRSEHCGWSRTDEEHVTFVLLDAIDGARRRSTAVARQTGDIMAEAFDASSRDVRANTKQHRAQDSSIFWTSDRNLEEWTSWIKNNPYSHIAEWFTAKGQTADEIIYEGWRFEEFPLVVLNEETDWVFVASKDRTWDFTLNTWEFMDPVIREFIQTGDQRYLAWCLKMAKAWAIQVLSSDTRKSMIWYDMSLALRSPRLASLLHLAVMNDTPYQELERLFSLVQAHIDAHEAEESFVPGNNHGFYAALGQIVLSQALECMPSAPELGKQGADRMRVVAEQQFLPDGGHAEHSPDYHRMLLTSFQQAIRQGVITDESVKTRIEKASEALGWFVQPNGKILQFGDSPARNMVQGKSRALSEQTKFITTNGRLGSPADRELFVMPETGYAIIRTPKVEAPDELKKSSYLAFMAGFHSRAHKHCDDLSIVWSHAGREILVDSGRYGYGPQLPKKSPLRDQGFFYASPERQYVESVAAHNTVTIDETNHDRRRHPYGSAITTAGHNGETFQLAGDVEHEQWRHIREVIFKPSESLIVEDEISTKDDLEHSFQLYFNVEGTLTVESGANHSCTIREEGLPLCMVEFSVEGAISGATLDIVKGGDAPLRGWRSTIDRKLEPTWSVRFTGDFKQSIRIASKFLILPDLAQTT